MMPVVGRLGRILGPQGKMPNPRVGTVTMDVGKAVEESKSGKVEYRTDRTANVHLTIGKTSFEESALLENFTTIMDEIAKAKPSGAKGRYLKTVTSRPRWARASRSIRAGPRPPNRRGRARPPRKPTSSPQTAGGHTALSPAQEAHEPRAESCGDR
jgi:hypothetical protein